MMVIDGAVLAGGRSSRFGTDKAQALFGGSTMLSIAVATMRQAMPDARLWVSTNVPLAGYDCVADNYAHAGPLGGIEAVLRTSEADGVIFAPCDMPLLDGAMLTPLIEHFKTSRRSVAYAADDGQPVPMPCLLARQFLPEVTDCLANGQRHSLRSLFASIEVDFIPLPSEFAPRLANVNTRANLAEALKIAT